MQYELANNQREKYRSWGLETLGMIMRDTDLTPDTLINPYGCNGLFDPCGDGDLISLAMCGADPFMDALGWRSSNLCRIIKQYLTWVGPTSAVGQNPGGYTPDGIVTDCCEDRKPVSWQTCEWEMENFGHLGNSGGAVCLYDDLKECEGMPDQFMLDGTPITSNLQFRATIASQVILQTLRWMIKNGNATTKGHFDGLDRIITTGVLDRKGQPCPALDSIVVDWQAGCYAGAGTSTWTDGRGTVAIPEGYSIVKLIYTLFRHLSRRRSMAPMLNSQGLQNGDFFIAGSSDQLECLRDCFVCETMCGGSTEQNIQIVINQKESREFYMQQLTGAGNYFGFGSVSYKGMTIPLIETDILGDDLYLLFRKVGNVPLLWGEYQDTASLDLSRIPGNHFRSSDGGRFLHYTQTDNTCVQEVTDFRPRIRYDGRFMQARIAGFTCDTPVKIPTCNPWDVNFYIPGPFTAATQPVTP